MIIAPDELTSRIRGEYREMPGLRLTFAQACRLWQLDTTTCSAVLDNLIAQRFLYRTADGTYIALPAPPPTPARATLSTARHAHAPVLRRA